MYNNYYPFYNQYNNRTNFKRFNLSNFLNSTQKALNLVNQVIPIVYQLKPLYKNAKTALKVANIIKNDNSTKEDVKVTNIQKKVDTNDSPTYFL